MSKSGHHPAMAAQRYDEAEGKAESEGKKMEWKLFMKDPLLCFSWEIKC
jgi:hypothetical protein